VVNESNHGSCLTELLDGRVGRIAVRECRRGAEICRTELPDVTYRHPWVSPQSRELSRVGRRRRTDVRYYVAYRRPCVTASLSRLSPSARAVAVPAPWRLLWDAVGVSTRVRDAILLTPPVEPLSRPRCLDLVQRRSSLSVLSRGRTVNCSSPCQSTSPGRFWTFGQSRPSTRIYFTFSIFHVCFLFLGNFVA